MQQILKTYIKKYKEFILYVLFGGLTTVVNIGAFCVLIELFGEKNYLWLNVIAWFLSVLFAFVTNKLWVFENGRPGVAGWLTEGVEFFAARGISLGIETVFLYVAIDLLALPKVWMKLAANVIVITVNYVFSKLIIFRQPKD